MKATAHTPEPVIECSPIRLTVDETKQLLRIATAGKPVRGDYHCNSLAEIGILKRIEITEEKDTPRKIQECWNKAKIGFAEKSEPIVHQAMHDIERLERDRDRNETVVHFDLTPLGKQIARGITVRLNSQANK